MLHYLVTPNGSKTLGIPMGTTLESKTPLNPEHFISIQELLERGDDFYSVKDSLTGEGFIEGFCFGDGDFYCQLDKDALKRAKEDGYKTLNASYKTENHYHSEWFPENGDGLNVVELEGIHYDVSHMDFEWSYEKKGYISPYDCNLLKKFNL